MLQGKKDFTLDSLIAAAYDSYLTWFEKPLPALIKAWDETPASDPLKANVAEQIALLRTWDLRWSVTSVPTSLAVFWGEELRRPLGSRRTGFTSVDDIGKLPAQQLLQSLAEASGKLQADFGTWKTQWGDIVQRLRTEHSRWLHLVAIRLAGVIRSARVHGHEEVVWHQRKQFRRGGGVR